MHGDGTDAPGLEVPHLVLHQGDERGDDQRDAVPQEGGDLETDRFAASRREDGEYIPSCKRFPDDLLLHGPEAFVAPIGFQYFLRRHFLTFFGKTYRLRLQIL